MPKILNGEAKIASLVINGDVNVCVADRDVAESDKYSGRTICVANKKILDNIERRC